MCRATRDSSLVGARQRWRWRATGAAHIHASHVYVLAESRVHEWGRAVGAMHTQSQTDGTRCTPHTRSYTRRKVATTPRRSECGHRSWSRDLREIPSRGVAWCVCTWRTQPLAQKTQHMHAGHGLLRRGVSQPGRPFQGVRPGGQRVRAKHAAGVCVMSLASSCSSLSLQRGPLDVRRQASAAFACRPGEGRTVRKRPSAALLEPSSAWVFDGAAVSVAARA